MLKPILFVIAVLLAPNIVSHESQSSASPNASLGIALKFLKGFTVEDVYFQHQRTESKEFVTAILVDSKKRSIKDIKKSMMADWPKARVFELMNGRVLRVQHESAPAANISVSIGHSEPNRNGRADFKFSSNRSHPIRCLIVIRSK